MKKRVYVYWEKDAEDGVARKDETGKAKRRFMDAVKEDMAEVEVTEEDTEYRNNCGDGKSDMETHDGKSRKTKKDIAIT